MKMISVTELLENEPEQVSGKFFAYVQETGYVAIKNYTTERRYMELYRDQNPLFVPVFRAEGYKDAKRKILEVLTKAVHFLSTDTLLKK